MHNRHMTQKGLFLQGLVLLHALWWLASFLLQTRVIPSPVLVYSQFGRLLQNQIPLHVLHSLWRVAAGVGLALATGVPIGIAMGTSSRWNRMLYPLVYLSYPIPKTALLPVAMLLWGMRDGSKIAILFLILVFQVIVAVRDSVQEVDPAWEQIVRSTGASAAQVLLHVTLPAIFPGLLSCLRVSLGTALSVLFFIEGYGTHWGIGYSILDAWSRIHYVDMYWGILVLALLGFGLFAAVDALYRQACGWKHADE